MTTHSSWPGGGAGGLGGLGPIFSGIDDGEPVKKFTSQECMDALIDRLTTNPEDVKNQINLVVSEQVEEYRKLHPEITNPDAWTRLSTHRPNKDENGEPLLGTDREVRLYENEVWADAGHVLETAVTTEHGEIHSIVTTVKW